jgi:putative heme-binding domain-containing protein
VRAAGNLTSGNDRLAEALVDMATDPRSAAPDILLQLAIAIPKIKSIEGRSGLMLSILARSKNDALITRIVWQNLHPLIESDPKSFVKVLGMWWPVAQAQLQPILPRVADRLLGSANTNPGAIAALFQLLESRDVSAARQCLAAAAARIQSGEIEGERLEKLRAELAPVIAKHVDAGAAHPLGLDAALVSVSWKNPRAIGYVRQTFTTTGLPPELRLRALGALIAAGDNTVLDDVAVALRANGERPPVAGQPSLAGFRGQILAALGRIDDPKVADTVLGVYSDLEPDVQPKAIELLTQRAVWAKALLAAIGQKRVPAEALGVNQVRKLLAGHDREIVKAVQSQWGTIREERDPKRDAVIGEMRTLIRKNPGDPHKGREVFKKVCGQCHKIYGEGEEVGPDITVNGRSSFEQLLSNVFDPSLVIGASYQARTILTTEGRVVTGLVAEESDQRVVLKVQGGKREVIPRSDIEEMKTSELSLMPEDLEKTLKAREIADLFAYIMLDKPPDDPSARLLPGAK